MVVTSPSEQGVDPAGVGAFLDAVEADARVEPHGLIVQRHGRRIVEGYWAPHTGGRRRLVYSLSKTFTGTALGLQVGEGRLALDDLVRDHLPEWFGDAPPATQRMRIRHIASMSTGHDRETLGEALARDPDNAVRGFLAIPPDAEPGTLFAYNQPPVLALATILQRLAGERLVDYLRPRLLEPLGIDDLRWAQLAPAGDMGFSGVYTDLDAIARLGQLHLDDGRWDGRRVLPAGWVADASARHIPNPQREEPDWRQGYGFQLWMSRHGYRGDGAFGQYMVVLPEQDAVVAMFSCIEDMQVVLDLMWEHLLPAMAGTPAPPSAADDALAARLAELALPTVAVRRGGTSVRQRPTAALVADSTRRSHRTLTGMDLAGDRIVVHEGRTSFDVPLTDAWTDVGPAMAASSTQLPDGVVAVDLVMLETPHRLELVLDPVRGTFVARWPLLPLFAAGADARLSAMRAPAS